MELRAEEISQIIKEQITDYDKEVELSGRLVTVSPVFTASRRSWPWSL
jgi:F-type H+-transporting ATPase subunit alpha